MRKNLRKLCYLWHCIVPRCRVAARDVTIDVVIPVCEKDLYTLPLCLEGVRRNVKHRIAAIYIVAAENPRVRAFCDKYALTFVEETSVLGYGPALLDITAGTPPYNRSGWIFQQLLKLSGGIGVSDYFLVIDSDHLLLRPHTFVAKDGRLVFYGSSEYHTPYYININRIMGFYPHSGISYVAHKMIFDRTTLAALRRELESRNGGRAWDKVIVESLDLREISGFSEFELFGNFVPAGGKMMLPWRQKAFTYRRLANFETLRRRYAWLFASITFPAYKSHGIIPSAVRNLDAEPEV